MKKAMLVLAVLLAAAWTAEARATVGPESEDCARVVFGDFCLCGGAEFLPPNPAQQDTEGRYLYRLGSGVSAVVEVQNGKLMRLSRMHKTQTWLEYMGLRSRMVSALGEPHRDLSYFPRHARDDSSRQTSIRIGSGRIAKVWNMDGYEVRLVWLDSVLGAAYTCEGYNLDDSGDRF